MQGRYRLEHRPVHRPPQSTMAGNWSCTGETLSFAHIVRNVIYSFFLLLTCIFTSVGLATYQWMETSAVSFNSTQAGWDGVHINASQHASARVQPACRRAHTAPPCCLATHRLTKCAQPLVRVCVLIASVPGAGAAWSTCLQHMHPRERHAPTGAFGMWQQFPVPLA